MSLVEKRTTQDMPDVETGTTEDRSAAIAVLAFPAIILGGAVLAWASPDTFTPLKPYILPGLMVIMFTMGLTITLPDLRTVVTRPIPIFLGVVCQFIVMPLSAVLISKVLGFSAELTIGLILLGSVPGGTSSNVISYLAKGDVALSVAMTSVSTVVSPLVTPMIMLLLAGESTAVDASGMIWALFKTVLFPVAAGLVLRIVASSMVDKVLPVLPWLSIVVIGGVLCTVVAGAAEKLATVGLVVVVGVGLQNLIGFVAGYWSARLSKQREAACRTTAIEVAMQNSALASGMAAKFFTPEAALPGAIASILANITGALYAAIVRRRQH